MILFYSVVLGGSVSGFARVNALCNLSRKKSREVAASLPDRFLCRCKKYRGKGMEGGNKVSLRRFLADQKIASLWGGKRRKNTFWGFL